MKTKFLILMVASTLFLIACADDRYSDIVENSQQETATNEDPLLSHQLDSALNAIEDLEALGVK